MKVDCVQEKLKSSVVRAEKVTGKNLSLPILGSVLLTAEGSALTIRATNLDLGIELSIPAKVEKEGALAISGSLLGNFLSMIPAQERISFESVNRNLAIKSARTSTTILSLPPEDFPTIPRVADGTSFSLSSDLLVDGLRAVWYAASVSDMKPEIASVAVTGEDGNLIFVATDSFRLAEKKIRAKVPNFPTLLLPFKNCVEIVRVFEGIHEPITLHFNKNQIACEGGGVYLTSRLVGGTFPNYTQIIPLHWKTRAVVSKTELAQALKLGLLFSDRFAQVNVKVSPQEELLLFESKNPDTGENSTRLEAVPEGEDLQMSFNVKYILDAFQSVPAEQMALTWNGVGKPMVLRGEGDESFTYLVMPMNR